MLETLQRTRRRSSDRDVRIETDPGGEDRDSVVESPLFRLGRLFFGGILAFMALDNLRNLDERVDYAASAGAPFPDLTVPGVSASLLLGSAGVALWRLPSLAAAAVAGFFASVTPVMHDFWHEEDPEAKQQQMIQFLKNGALFGAALAFLRLGRRR